MRLADPHHVPSSITDASRVFGPAGQPRRSKVEEGWPDISGVLRQTGRALFICEGDCREIAERCDGRDPSESSGRIEATVGRGVQ